MSEVSVSEEMEQVAAELHQVALAEAALGEKELVELITEWKAGGKDDTLRQAIASVKKGLSDKTASISAMMNCGDFVPVLISGLQAKTVEVQLNVMSIVDLILKDGDRPEAGMIIGSGMIPALITLLTSEEDAVCQQALEVLRDVVFVGRDSTRSHFQNSNSIPTLIKLAEETENTDRLDNIAVIVQQFCPNPNVNPNEPEKESRCSMSAVHELINLFRVLMSKELTPTIALSVLSGIGGLSRVEGSFGEIVSSGILPFMVHLLTHPEKITSLSTISALANLLRAAKSDEKRLQFFQALRGSSGLKHFWKIVFYPKTKPEEGEKCFRKEMSLHALRFMSEVNKVFTFRGEVKSDLIEPLIQTGFVLSLVKCLKKEAELEHQVEAMNILMNLLIGMSKKNLKPILDAGLVPLLVEQLKNSDVRLREMAPLILKHLVSLQPTIRDEVVSLGGLQQMIRMLKNEQEELGTIVSVMVFLVQIFQFKPRPEPKVPLEVFEGLPEALKVVLAEEARYNSKGPEKATELTTIVFACLIHLREYGDCGIDLIMRAGLFEVFVGILSSSQHHEKVLYSSLTAVVSISMVKEYGQAMLKLGVLDSFPKLLRNPSDLLRKLAIFSLKPFLDGKLTPGQKKTIVEMKPMIEAEKKKGLPITLQLASLLLSNIEEKMKQ